MEQVNSWKVYTDVPHDLDYTSYVVYVIEYADRVKIGRTKHPAERIRTHKRNAEIAGRTISRVAIKTVGSYGYCAAEKELLHIFADKRIDGTEEFAVSFEEVLNDDAKRKANQTISELELLKEENKRLSEELKFAKKIAEALGFDWTKFYEEKNE